MIETLRIRNIALIRELNLSLGEGLIILSGETGAGKSIIIDSLNFVLGDRADKTLIRHGERTASVEISFTTDDLPEAASAALKEAGISTEDEDYIIVSRTLNENGRNECRIGGAPVPLATLKRVMQLAVDVHSQHEHQSLLNENNHIEILDRYAGLAGKKAAFRTVLSEYRAVKAEAASYADAETRARKMDLLRYQIEEIERVDVQPGEEESLIAARAKCNNAQRILNALNAAATLLNGDEGFGAVPSAHTAMKEILSISQYDAAFSALADRLESAKIELSDIADTLLSEAEANVFDARELDRIEKRLEDVRKIQKRFGATEEALAAFLAGALAELDILTHAEARLVALQEELVRLETVLLKEANALHAAREQAASRLSEAIVSNLKDLGMPNVVFMAELTFPQTKDALLENLNERGGDAVRFLISPNKGEPLKPLAKIASGGEMSRFMLGLKNITAALEGIPTLVFDEIDTGISGRIAKVVACKLYDVSVGRQVLAVTHLPQLAAMADVHYLIEKREGAAETTTSILCLNAEDSLAEVMRLAGAGEGSASGLESAKELKKWANDHKNSISNKKSL